MTGFLIVIGLFVAVVIVMGVRYDLRQRGIRSRGGSGSTHGRFRLDNQTRADKWGGPS